MNRETLEHYCAEHLSHYSYKGAWTSPSFPDYLEEARLMPLIHLIENAFSFHEFATKE